MSRVQTENKDMQRRPVFTDKSFENLLGFSFQNE